MTRLRTSTLGVALALAVTASACSDDARDHIGADADVVDTDAATSDTEDTADTDAGGICDDHDPLRNLYFGDLHVHTSLSFDAWINDVRSTPDDAWRFARGEPARLPPLGPDGVGTREVRLARALDFAAVTDHAEYLAEIDACTTPGSAAYETTTCSGYRAADDGQTVRFGSLLTAERPSRFADICAALDCDQAAMDVWDRVVASADRHDDPCAFTALLGYEWTGATGVSNYHRNVLYRDLDVDAPISYFEEPTPEGLWRALDAQRPQGGVLAIPHNANMSDGQMFHPDLWDEVDDPIATAERRARIERALEIVQHKGDGECMNGLAAGIGAEDELCDFEQLAVEPFRDCRDERGVGGMAGIGCASPYDYLRGILTAGIALSDTLGTNPYRLGAVSGTDTHNGTPGFVDEASYEGHVGSDEDTPQDRLAEPGLLPGGVRLNPGGLTGVWAPENTREAIFDAIHARETYSTSGPRLRVRFFGAPAWSAEPCGAGGGPELGYAEGVPMGGTLPELEAPPSFFVQAAADIDSSVGLARVQIVKGWLDGDGVAHERVYDLSPAASDTSLSLDTCEASGGAATACETWTDPAWAPDQRAWYYARVVEAPTCRWSWRTCLSLPADERPPACDDPAVPRVVQERAVTSPIWTH